MDNARDRIRVLKEGDIWPNISRIEDHNILKTVQDSVNVKEDELKENVVNLLELVTWNCDVSLQMLKRS